MRKTVSTKNVFIILISATLSSYSSWHTFLLSCVFSIFLFLFFLNILTSILAHYLCFSLSLSLSFSFSSLFLLQIFQHPSALCVVIQALNKSAMSKNYITAQLNDINLGSEICSTFFRHYVNSSPDNWPPIQFVSWISYRPSLTQPT